MAADAGYLSHVMELLTPLGGVNSRSMFGGYGIFHDGDMFALIAGSTLYFKVGDSSIASYEAADSNRFQSMPYYEVPADIIEDTDRFQEWAGISIAIGHATARKKRK